MLTSELQEGHKISLIVDRLDFDSELVFIREDYLLISLIGYDGIPINVHSYIKI